MTEAESSIIYSQKRKVSAFYMDCTSKLGLSHAAGLIQDNLTECFGAIEVDNYSFNRKFNAFWVFTKTKIHFERRPEWEEVVLAETFPASNAVFRTEINSIFKDKDNKILFKANTECCCLDLNTHRPKKLTDTDFPKENFPTPVFEEKFTKFDFETTESDYVYSQQVRCQLMDMSNHLNNIEYVKMGVGVLDADFIKSHEIKDIEVHYLGECKEFQELKLYKTEKDGKIYVRIKESDRTVFEMSMSFSAE